MTTRITVDNVKPHPPRADGEGDLPAKRAKTAVSQSIFFTHETSSWGSGRAAGRASYLANLVHHPGKLDGV